MQFQVFGGERGSFIHNTPTRKRSLRFTARPPSPCEIVKKVMRIPTWMKVDLPRLPLTQHIPKEQRRRRTQLAESKSGGGQAVSMAVSQSVSYFTVPPRTHPSTGSQSLRRSRSNTSTEYSLPGATQLSQVRSVSPSLRGCRVLHVVSQEGPSPCSGFNQCMVTAAALSRESF